MISGHHDLQKAYQDDHVAREYIGRRFETPLGSLLHKSQVAVVRALIAAHGIRRAIEIAPGPARLSVDVVQDLASATLIDASAQMLSEAARRLTERRIVTPVQLVQADAFNLPLQEAAELVYTFRLIRHFDRADRLRLYRQIHGVLKPGGWLVFDAVNEVVSAPIRAASKPGEHEHFDALLRPDQIREELREAGFELTSLAGVQHKYHALLKIQVLVAPRSDTLARALMGVLDRFGGEPLEWVVTCRRV